MTLWLHGLVRSFGELNHYISITTVPMTTKHGSMETYLDGLLPIKAHDMLIMCSCNLTWHIKTIIYPIPQCLSPLNITWWLTLSSSYLWSYSALFASSCKITEQTRAIISPFLLPLVFLPFLLTWLGGDIQWRAHIRKVTWPFNHVVLWGHMTN